MSEDENRNPREELVEKRRNLEDQLRNKREKLDDGNISETHRRKLRKEINDIEEEIERINDYIRPRESSKDSAHAGTWGRNERFDRIESEIERLGGELANINSILEDENLKKKTEEFEKLVEKNKSLENDAEQLADKLSDLMNVKVSDSLGGDFEQRKSDIDDSLQTWKWLTGTSIFLLIVASGLIYWDIATSTSSGNLNVLSKIALLLPISVAVWFTSNNYQRERMLKEEYAFKSTLSTSLDGFRKVVQKELPEEHSDKMGEFLTESMTRIYSNPHSNIENKNEGAGTGVYAEIARRITKGNQ